MRTKLLLADDSITIQKVVGIIFASEDYELVIVDTGNAVLARAREFMPDVLLIDAVMPGMTGYEVCEEVRRDPALKAVPILLLTGAFEAFDDDKAKQCGADDFISKPFESQQLIDKVSELIDLGRRRALAVRPPASEAAEPVQPVAVKPVPSTPVPHPLPTVAAPAAQTAPAAADVFSLGAEPAQASAPPAAAAHDFEFEMVEGTAEDDLWGAFDLEDEAEGAAADFDESAFAVEPLAGEEDEAGELFGFADEPEAASPSPVDSAEGFAAEWGSGSDTAFSFAEEEPPVLSPLPPKQDEFIVETVSNAGQDLADVAAYAPPAEQEFDLQFAPEEDFMPSEHSLTSFATTPLPVASPAGVAPESTFAPGEEFVPAPEAPTPAAVPSAPAPGAPVALSEAQLSDLVSRISRDIIEKIAWEVVPDLAETIIKEEIRKIKEGV
jgi:CheY-like chemotaxis protein